MRREEIEELHFITHFTNVPSVLELGILSKRRARRLRVPPVSVANEEVQDRRAAVQIPDGGPLHSYANLYVHARNAMMYVLHADHSSLAVIRVDPAVLDLDGVIVADRNAASGSAVFRTAEEGIEALNADDVFAEWWNQDRDAKQKRCAEVLVPGQVPPGYVTGAYVKSEEGAAMLSRVAGQDLVVTVDARIFFG